VRSTTAPARGGFVVDATADTVPSAGARGGLVDGAGAGADGAVMSLIVRGRGEGEGAGGAATAGEEGVARAAVAADAGDRAPANNDSREAIEPAGRCGADTSTTDRGEGGGTGTDEGGGGTGDGREPDGGWPGDDAPGDDAVPDDAADEAVPDDAGAGAGGAGWVGSPVIATFRDDALAAHGADGSGKDSTRSCGEATG
jgi:hypothetical protein